MRQNFVFISIVFAFFFSTLSTAQDKVLQLEDYSKWKRIVSSKISSNGEWFTYGLRPNGGDDTLFIKKTTAATSDFSYRIPYASSPSFSSNSKWAAYLISPSKKTAKKLKSQGRKHLEQLS